MNIQRLREIREDNDFRQIELAEKLGITQAQYSRYELGVNTIPLEKLIEIALIYRTSVDYLLGLTDVRKPYPKSVLNGEANQKQQHK